jgi:hypothetical protein
LPFHSVNSKGNFDVKQTLSKQVPEVTDPSIPGLIMSSKLLQIITRTKIRAKQICNCNQLQLKGKKLQGTPLLGKDF